MRQYLILDVGTSSVRAALIDETLRILRLETARRTAPALFDAEAEWTLLHALMKTAASGAGDLAGVAVSALLGWVGTDARGNAVTPCFTYMHACPEEYAASPWDAEEAYRVCRRAPAPESGCFQLARVKARDPEAYGRTTAFLSLKDFINGKLTGAFATDATTAAYTLLYDVGAGRWSVRALEALGLERDKLPPLSVPGAALAPLSPALCRELGLSQAPPVAVGSVDGSTGILGAGGLEEGDVVSVMGTTDVFFAVQAHPCEDRTRRLLVNPHVAAGRWLIGGPMGMYGGALDWFSRDLLGGSRPLSELDALAEAVPPGSEGVTFLPTLAGGTHPLLASCGGRDGAGVAPLPPGGASPPGDDGSQLLCQPAHPRPRAGKRPVRPAGARHRRRRGQRRMAPDEGGRTGPARLPDGSQGGLPRRGVHAGHAGGGGRSLRAAPTWRRGRIRTAPPARGPVRRALSPFSRGPRGDGSPL